MNSNDGAVRPPYVGGPQPGGGPAARVPQGGAQAGQPLALLRAVRRRWPLALGLGMVLAGSVGAAIWFLLPPPKPNAVAKLLMMPPTAKGILYEHPDPPLDRQTQVAVIRGSIVLSAALNSVDVNRLTILQGQDPIEWLKKSIAVDFTEGNEIIRISLSGDDGEQVRVLVDAVAKAYEKEVSKASDKHRNDQLARLKETFNTADNELKQLQKKVADKAQPIGASDPANIAAQQYLTLDELRQAHKVLDTVHTTLFQLKLDEVKLTARGRAGDPAPAVDAKAINALVDEDPRVKKNREERVELDKEIVKTEAAARNWRSQWWAKWLVDRDMANHWELAELREELWPQAEARLLDRGANPGRTSVDVIRDQINEFEKMEKHLKEQIGNLAAKAKDLNKSNLDLEPFRIDIKNAAALVERVSRAIHELTVEKEAPPRVTFLEKAAITRVDVEARKLRFAALGALGGAALACLLVGLWELRLRRVDSPESVTKSLGLRLIGTVPSPPRRLNRLAGSYAGARWQAVLTESIDHARTMLLHGAGLSSARVILVTSAVSGEGKTSLSTHLAVSLARAGRRTLLVDGDLRSPAVCQLFGLTNSLGLAEVLRGELAVTDVLVPAPVDGLHVLPAGISNVGTIQGLSQEGVSELFGWMRQNFEFVIVDSSPVLPVADALLLARHTDGVIFSALQEVSRLTQMEEAERRIASLGIRILGAVVNGTSHDVYGYGHRYVIAQKA